MSEYPSVHRSQPSSAKPSSYAFPLSAGTLTSHISQTKPAKWAYSNFIECIYNFEMSLDENHEVGARLLPFTSEATFYIQDVHYHDPHMIIFCGCRENGEKLQLIQHVSQLSVFLVPVKKRGKEPVRIGFKLKRAAEEGS